MNFPRLFSVLRNRCQGLTIPVKSSGIHSVVEADSQEGIDTEATTTHMAVTHFTTPEHPSLILRRMMVIFQGNEQTLFAGDVNSHDIFAVTVK